MTDKEEYFYLFNYFIQNRDDDFLIISPSNIDIEYYYENGYSIKRAVKEYINENKVK